MHYPKTKVYFDGSHYIGIPQPIKKLKKKKIVKKVDDDKKQEFEKVYKENLSKTKKEKKEILENELSKHFENKKQAKEYVERNLERKKRNSIVRRTRLARKVNLQEWNYFCTFTYDDSKLNEEDFRKKLSNCFKKLSYRKKWKYVGVWERSPVNKRLHFHGLFYIPTMIGELIEIKDYSTKKHQMQVAHQNTYFRDRFGRNDFKSIESKEHVNESKNYLMKYIEKTNEKIVYSKGLPTYFVSDILEEDVICTIGQEDRKILLFDNFTCLDEGLVVGKVSKETIEQMPKCN
ncbi:MAG: hypothetical protein IJW59_00030 [Clostridia bacterium]|nr:hypothetical protein [Clostridia bacterium]